MGKGQSRHESLLTEGVDPPPVEEICWDEASPLLLVCEHAGRVFPQRLGTLGLSADQLDLHITYDIGAEKVAAELACLLGCRLVLQRYSRLVIDCNRPPGSVQSIPETSDSITIPGNVAVSADERRRRELAIFEPFAERCLQHIANPRVGFAFSIHSFTPQMSGQFRPWDIGFLFRHPASEGERLASAAESIWPDKKIGCNEPYQIEDDNDWFIPACAEPRAIPHCLIEIRNDHLLSDAGCQVWAQKLHRLLSTFMETTA